MLVTSFLPECLFPQPDALYHLHLSRLQNEIRQKRDQKDIDGYSCASLSESSGGSSSGPSDVGEYALDPALEKKFDQN